MITVFITVLRDTFFLLTVSDSSINHFPKGTKTTPIAKKIPTTIPGLRMGRKELTRCCRKGVSAGGRETTSTSGVNERFFLLL